MKTPLEILTEARALIEDPEHWTQGMMARRGDPRYGAVRHTFAVDATCWCVTGAVMRVGQHEGFAADGTPPANVAAALNALRKYAPSGSLIWLNDGHTHAEVLAAFDAAIADARALI